MSKDEQNMRRFAKISKDSMEIFIDLQRFEEILRRLGENKDVFFLPARHSAGRNKIKYQK